MLRGEGNYITAADPDNNSPAYNDSFTTNPHFMAGPVLNMKLSERLSLGLVLLLSQHYTLESSYTVKNPAETFTAHNYMKFRRYDSDLTANYRIGSGWTVFLGLKYFRWEGTGSFDVLTSSGAYFFYLENDVLGQALGPALGFSYSRPIVEMLFFSASFSGIYMKGKTTQTDVRTIPSYDKEVMKEDRSFIGYNCMAGLGWYFESLRSTLIIGGRVQYLKMDDDPRDLFYGITATVLYSF